VTVALHHRIDGPADAPPLLLGNALGTALDLWDPALEALTTRQRVIRYDHRGQGASPVPPAPYTIDDLGRDLLALMDRLEIERAAYAGISIGGMVGLWLAAHAPQRITRVVACCTSAHPREVTDWAERAARVRAAGTTAPIAQDIVARWVTPTFAQARPEIAERLLAMLVASPPEGYAGCCDALEVLDLREDLTRIRVPTLVIGAEGDQALPPGQARVIAAAVPGARFELLAGAAHIPVAERPDELSALILDGLEAP
jgi:3-oxoadipate enol-lactonase